MFSRPIPVIAADPETVQFASPNYLVTETGVAAVILITRTGSTAGTATVDYATSDGTGKNGVNYTAESGTVTFDDGQATATITIPVADDGIVDGGTTFLIELTNPTSASLGAVTQAVVTVADSDTAGEIQFASATFTVDRALALATLDVTRLGGSQGTATVEFRVTGGTAVGLAVLPQFGESVVGDYVDNFGTVTFAPGQTTAQITFNYMQELLNNDFDTPVYRGPQTIQVTLGNPTGAATLGQTITSVLTIDDEEDQHGAFGFSRSYNSPTVNESDDKLQITVFRAGQISTTESISYSTVDGTAKAGTNYIATSGAFTFQPGDRQAFFSVPIIDDRVVDNPGDFQIVLSNPSGGAFIFDGLDKTDIQIVDGDTPLPGHFVAIASPVGENEGSATITVYRLDGAQGVAQVDYATSDGTATAGADYTATSGTLTFNNGETIKTFTVPILPDNLVEGDETFFVTLSNPTNGASVGTIVYGGDNTEYDNPAVETIVETPGQIAFTANDYRAAENNASFTVTVTFTLAPGANLVGDPNTNNYVPVTVDYSTHDGTATAGADYTAVSGTLVINPYLGTLTFTVPILNDLLAEPDETIFLTLFNATGGASIAGSGTATITILDEDSQQAAQTTITSSLPTGSTYGQAITFTAKVDSSSGTPSGSVDFVDQTTGQDLGSAPLSLEGGAEEASVNVPGLVAESHTIVATYTSTAGTFLGSNDSLLQVVAPATLTVMADNKNRVYGSSNPPLTDTITGFVNSDTPSVVSGTAGITTDSTAASGVGSYAIDVSVGTLSVANYTFAFSDGTLSVTPATLTVTADNKTMVDGAPIPALTDTITGFVNNDGASIVAGAATLSTTATSSSGVGNYPITVGPGTLSAANYTFILVNGTLSITSTIPMPTLTLTDNTGLAVEEGSSATLTDAMLQTIDSDASAPASMIIYTLTAAPTQGVLSVDRKAIAPGDTFSQQDVNDGNVTYQAAEEGGDSFAFDAAAAGAVGTNGTFSITISDPAIVPTGSFTYAATEGAASNAQTVATFTDPGGAESLTDYMATIDWGDGMRAAAGVVSLDPTTRVFTVSGQHNYVTNGTYPITVVLSHEASAMVTVASTAVIDSATITGSGGLVATAIALTGHEFSTLNAPVATFTDGDGSLPATDFSATIDWGDGKTSSGGISFLSGTYTIAGAHDYTDEGVYKIHVSADQSAGPVVGGATSATVSATITVHEQLLAEGTAGSPNQKYIQEIYRDLFARQAEPAGREIWVGDLAAGVPRGDVAYDIAKVATSEEFQYDTVKSLYQQYLRRAPALADQAAGAAYLYSGGGTIEGLAEALVGSQEYFQVRGGGAVNGFLQALFQDVLGRQIESNALTYFSGLLDSGQSTYTIAQMVFSSAEYEHVRVNALYEQLLDRPADPAGLAVFVAELAHGVTDEAIIAQILSSDEYFARSQA